jgi:hypothetical protein
MTGDLIAVLEEAKSLLTMEGNDYTWSSWPDEEAATTELDQFIKALENDEPFDPAELAFLFAPTGRMQEVSLSSGWGDEFLKLSERSDRLIVGCYLTAAEQGDADAQYKLGIAYCQGDNVPQDDAQAAKWFRKAAEKGFALAQNNLGVLYYKGEGVPQDNEQAAQWFRNAAEQGLANAQYNLGIAYDAGQGVPQDEAEALKWFRKAAEQGDARAQSILGVMYERGQGLPQDLELAAEWYRRAAEQGFSPAIDALAELGESVSGAAN